MGKVEADGASLSVSGEGQVQVKADRAFVHLSAITEAKEANAALMANGGLTQAIVERMLMLDIPRDKMRTSSVSVFPIYDGSPAQIVGYRAENTLIVDAAVERAGMVLDNAVAAGANQVGGVYFGLSQESALREQALKAAVEAARRDAQAVVSAMGVALGRARTVEIEPRASGGMFLRAAEKSAPGTPILAGDITVAARVRVVYDLSG